VVAASARCLNDADALQATGARVIATAPDAEAARREVQKTIDPLLAGLRSTAA
jgi:hypothetical protein